MTSRARAAGVGGVGRQLGVVVASIAAYFVVRGMTEGDADTAIGHARDVLRVEDFLKLDFEAGLQRFALRHRLLVDIGNWVYIWGHWPVLVGTLIVLYLRRPQHYLLLRNAMLVSGAVGLVIFATWPVAPPRLLPGSAAYVDTVTRWSRSYRVLQPSFVVNKYAALPSYHVGWNLLAGVMLWRSFRERAVRLFAVASPLLMAYAVVVTANHYQLDSIVGSILALAGLWVAEHHLRRRHGGVRSVEPVSTNAG